MTIDVSVTSEVAHRIGLAAASFGRLSDRVFSIIEIYELVQR